MEATQMRSAREVLQTADNSLNDAIQVDAPRFFVQFGWDVLRLDTHAVPNQYLLRGEITPCKSFPQLAPIQEIREGELVPGSETGMGGARGDSNAIYGKYLKRAYYEAERLLDIERSTNHKQGLFEIRSLQGLNAVVYDRVDLNQLFYAPYTLATLPEENEKLIAHLRARTEQIKKEGVEGVPAQFQEVLGQIGDDLIQASEYNHRIQQARIEFTHSCMKLPPSDPSGLWKREYDLVDEEMLKRTGTPRVHSAEINTAKALDKLTDRNDNEGLKALAEALMQQSAQQKQIIDMLMAEREPKTPKGRPKAE